MLKKYFTFLCIVSLSQANLFTVTDKHGNVFKSKNMKHTPKCFSYPKSHRILTSSHL